MTALRMTAGGGRLPVSGGAHTRCLCDQTDAAQLRLQFDRSRGRGEMMVVDGEPINHFELTEQDVVVSAVRFRRFALNFGNAGNDARMPEQPVAGICGPTAACSPQPWRRGWRSRTRRNSGRTVRASLLRGSCRPWQLHCRTINLRCSPVNALPQYSHSQRSPTRLLPSAEVVERSLRLSVIPISATASVDVADAPCSTPT
jgi:hypothetical protein